MGDSTQLMMSSYPHAVKLVEVATYAVYVTDGVVERVIIDRERHSADDDTTSGDQGVGEIGQDTAVDPRITAYFTSYSNVLYTSYDTACETAFSSVEPCLDKGDMLFVIDSKYATEFYDPALSAVTSRASATTMETGNLYTINKIYKEDPTMNTFTREDPFRIVLDKNVPFAGTTTTDAFGDSSENATYVGVVNLFKFSPATTGNYEFVAQCSNRGTCDEGNCECFKGYTNDNCDTQSSLAV